MVKALTSSLFSEFYELFKEIMLEGYGGFSNELSLYFLNVTYTPDNLLSWCDSGIRVIYVSINDNKIDGFIVGDNTYGGVGFISWLGVTALKRNQGIGRELLKRYELYAKEKSAHLLELVTYPKQVNFYENNGYVNIGKRESGYFGQKNIIMNKKIGEWSDANLK